MLGTQVTLDEAVLGHDFPPSRVVTSPEGKSNIWYVYFRLGSLVLSPKAEGFRLVYTESLQVAVSHLLFWVWYLTGFPALGKALFTGSQHWGNRNPAAGRKGLVFFCGGVLVI